MTIYDNKGIVQANTGNPTETKPLYESEAIVPIISTPQETVIGKPYVNNVNTQQTIGSSIIVDVPMSEPITSTTPTVETTNTGTSIISEPIITPIPVVEPPKAPTASVTITNVPLVGDGITGILGSIGGIGGIGGGSGATGGDSSDKEISASMPNLLFYLGIALAIVIGYKLIKKK